MCGVWEPSKASWLSLVVQKFFFFCRLLSTCAVHQFSFSLSKIRILPFSRVWCYFRAVSLLSYLVSCFITCRERVDSIPFLGTKWAIIYEITHSVTAKSKDEVLNLNLWINESTLLYDIPLSYSVWKIRLGKSMFNGSNNVALHISYFTVRLNEW